MLNILLLPGVPCPPAPRDSGAGVPAVLPRTSMAAERDAALSVALSSLCSGELSAARCSGLFQGNVMRHKQAPGLPGHSSGIRDVLWGGKGSFPFSAKGV